LSSDSTLIGGTDIGMTKDTETIVDFGAILGYAAQFPEIRMLGRRGIDQSRIHHDNAPVSTSVESFTGVREGARFGDAWVVRAISVRGREADVECAHPRLPSVSFFVGKPEDGPGCPFDRPGFRIGYHGTRIPWETLQVVGNEFADMVEQTTIQSTIRQATQPSLDADRTLEIRPDGKVYIRLTNDCQERCVFCFFFGTPQEQGSGPVPAEAIIRAIDSLDPAVVNQVILTGGEPVLADDFPSHLRRLLDRGFRDIVVQTNGLFPDKGGFLEMFAGFRDRVSFGFSLHAATSKTNAAVTRAGSASNLELKMSAIRKAVSLGYMTKITCVLTRMNLDELKDIVTFCASTGEGSGVPDNVVLQFSMPVIRGLMEDSRDACPTLSEAQAALTPAIDLAVGLGLRVSMSSMCSLPPCRMRGYLRHLESMWYAVSPSQWWESERAFGHACSDCVLKPWCSGVSPRYLEWFGDNELLPFPESGTAIIAPKADGRSG